MKRHIVLGSLMLAAVMGLSACQSSEETEKFPYPIQPETFLSDMVRETDEAYEISVLPWFMPFEEAQKTVEEAGYELVYQDEWGTFLYQADGTLQDGTEILEEVWLEKTPKESKLVDPEELGAVNITFYMQEQEKADQLSEVLFKQVEDMRDVGKGRTSQGKEELLEIKKESGSWIRVQNAGKMIQEEMFTGELPWEDCYAVKLSFWLPIEKIDFMMEGVEE